MKTWKRPAMVDWYGPRQLAMTGVKKLLSTLLGSMIDTRRLQVRSGRDEDCVVDYSQSEEFCFDYMADTGDGWDSTYSMAYLLTRPYIEVSGERLERADIAILGGDEVYPVASRRLYAQRLVSPFNQAPRDIRKEPEFSRLERTDLFMIPGNHDWYDSLGAFSRRFLAYRVSGELKTRALGQFDVRQVRSYFVLKLPHDWEVWAIDVQLGHDIDNDQYIFFRKHAETIGPQTRIILCLAEPTIVSGQSKQESGLEFNVNRITWLAYNKGARVLVQLAGDIHNYQRYQVEAQTRAPGEGNQKKPYTRQNIVSGGGGAFLHTNHGFNKGSDENPRIEPLQRYPDRDTSRRLTKKVILFAFTHKGVAALIGLLYLAFFWPSARPPDFIDEYPFPPDIYTILAWYPFEHPGTFLLMLIAVGGCAAFAGFDSFKTKLLGIAHGIAHIALAILCWGLGFGAADLLLEPLPPEARYSLLATVYLPRLLVFVFGALLGGTLFGIYLWFSLNVLRLHHDETSSGLSWPHHKHFLRCRIQGDGSLAIHVVGVDNTASEHGKHPVKTHLVEKVVVTG
ncbi:MAG: hypothetical protein V3T83_02545 [Acidobacteriota bacterium]